MAEDLITPTPVPARTDAVIWADILKLQLDGVMMHVTLFENYNLNGLTGYMYLHHHHAEEEFCSYLHVLGDYINSYKITPSMSNVLAPVVKIDGTTIEEKMVKGLQAYESWENSVCEKLKNFQKELSEGKEYVEELIADVHKELKCIHLMENDLLDGKYEELNNWLIKKWGS